MYIQAVDDIPGIICIKKKKTAVFCTEDTAFHVMIGCDEGHGKTAQTNGEESWDP